MAVARAVELWWSGGGLVVAWRLSGGGGQVGVCGQFAVAENWRWRSSGSGGQVAVEWWWWWQWSDVAMAMVVTVAMARVVARAI